MDYVMKNKMWDWWHNDAGMPFLKDAKGRTQVEGQFDKLCEIISNDIRFSEQQKARTALLREVGDELVEAVLESLKGDDPVKEVVLKAAIYDAVDNTQRAWTRSE